MDIYKASLSATPALRTAIALAAGIACGWLTREWLMPYGQVLLWSSLAGLLLLLLLNLLHVKHIAVISAGALPVMIAIFGTAILLLQVKPLEIKWPGETQTHLAVVTDQPRQGLRSTRYPLRLLRPQDGHDIMLTVPSSSLTDDTIGPGEIIAIDALITPPHNAGNPDEFDYARWLMLQGFSGQAYSRCAPVPAPSPIAAAARASLPVSLRLKIQMLQWRTQLVSRLNDLPASSRDQSILAAILLGDKSMLSRSTRQLFAQAGASHVLALSGLHLGILVGFLLYLLHPLMQQRRQSHIVRGAALLLTWAFVLLTGASLSLLRAALMFSVFILCYRGAGAGNTLNSLGLSALIILLISPTALFDVGFQLSFLSVISILLLMPVFTPWIPRQPILKAIASMGFVSFAAQAGVAPLVAYYFHTFPLYFILTNLVVIPCAYVLLALGLVYIICFSIGIISHLTGIGLAGVSHLMTVCIRYIDSLPGTALTVYPSAGTLMLSYLMVAMLYLAWYRRNRYILILALGLVLSTAGSIAYSHRPGRLSSRIVCYNRPACPAIHFIQSADVSWLWTAKPEKADDALEEIQRTYWAKHHMRPPRLLKGHCREQGLQASDGIVSLGHYITVILSRPHWHIPSSGRPLDVDLLYICRGGAGNLTLLNHVLHPRLVALDSSLPKYQADRLAAQCRSLGWPVHDIRSQGALCIEATEK